MLYPRDQLKTFRNDEKLQAIKLAAFIMLYTGSSFEFACSFSDIFMKNLDIPFFVQHSWNKHIYRHFC